MNKSKRQTYISNLYGALHTLSGVTDEKITLNAQNHLNIKSCQRRKKRNEDCEETYLQLNPNKGQPNNAMIKSYSEFEKKMDSIFMDIGGNADRFRIKRADMSFNSDVKGDYEAYRKLNKLILCCLSDAFTVKNCFESRNIWTFDSLNLAIKADEFEAENYNKELEAHGSVPTTNRLELRSLKMRDTATLRHEFLDKWCNRLDKAIDHFYSVQMRYNDSLEKLYKEDLAKPKRFRRYVSRNAFLVQYSDCIFCTDQLVDLMERFGAKNPESSAKNFKRYHKTEFYSKNDLEVVVRAIKKCMKRYFNK